MATAVSQLSQSIQVIIPIDEIRTIRAKKSIKAGAKNIHSTFSEQMDYLVGLNAVLDGFDISYDSSGDILIPTGSFIQNGLIGINLDSTTISDNSSLVVPYYLYGNIANDSSNPYIEFGLSQNQNASLCLLATRDSTGWVMPTKIQLGDLWELFLNHEDNINIHSDDSISSWLASPSNPDSTNPYATKADLYTYDRAMDANDILTSLITLLELEMNSNDQLAYRFKFDNMFADTIPVSGSIKFHGKYGTFINACDHSNIAHIGLSGIFNDSDLTSFSFETGIIKQVDNIDNNILLTVKETLIDCASGVTYDLSTDGSSYQITGVYPNFVLDSTDLSVLNKSPNGTYDLQFRFTIPAVSGGNYWTSRQSMINPSSSNACHFINNKCYIIGGFDSSSNDSGIQEYDTFSDSYRMLYSSLSRTNIASSKDLIYNKINIFNGSDASNIVSNILELTLSNQSIITVSSGMNATSSTSCQRGCDVFSSLYGTGHDSSSYYNDWLMFQNVSKVSSYKTNYPNQIAGVSSASHESLKNKTYHYGGKTSSSILSQIMSYGINSDSFTNLSPAESGSPNSDSYSNGESFEPTLKGTLLYAGRIYDSSGVEAYMQELTEYNILTNTLYKRANMPVDIGNVALCLASNGKVYSFGGSTPTNISNDSNYEYTHNSMIYLYGWAVEWL